MSEADRPAAPPPGVASPPSAVGPSAVGPRAVGPSAVGPGRVGIVAIGRNEGPRLSRCLASIDGAARALVYVDSGSTDDSRALAGAAGATVVDLDTSRPFTAARARNAGFAALLREDPGLEFVQFVDGDCQLAPHWLERAAARLREDPGLAVVCGRRREMHPEASVFNRLCDIEWDTPVGEAAACGGDAMMRVAAFRAVGGFADALIAGEEPELCLRLRRAGWRIERLDAEMTRHDAAMSRLGQWWRRAVRAGFTYAEGLAMYGWSYPSARAAASAIGWTVLLPAAVVLATAWLLVAAPRLAWVPVAAAALAVGALVARVARRLSGRAHGRADAFAYGLSCALGKWAETQGMFTYVWRRVRGSEGKLIEYKDRID